MMVSLGRGHYEKKTYVIGDAGGCIKLSAACILRSVIPESSRLVGVNESMWERLGVHTFSWFPNSKQLDKEVVTESRIHHLRNEEDVGTECTL